MADLKDFPIGTHFWYLQRMCVVIEHESYDAIKVNYVDDSGIIRSHYFAKSSFDFVARLVETARQAEADERTLRSDRLTY